MNKILIEPVLIGNVAKAAHPYGCQKQVYNQIEYVKKMGEFNGPKKVLILGASSSYGLASRIALAFGCHADTIGVSFERGIVNEDKLATAGWWNNIFFKEEAEKDGLIAKNFIGDAFSLEMKENVINYIKEKFGKIDLLIYSLASGRRKDPFTGVTYWSALKPVDKPISGYGINLEKQELIWETVDPATKEEINNTMKVMGGEDWELWIDSLLKADCLKEGFKTTLFTYIGSDLTKPFYGSGTLGLAKRHTEETSNRMDKVLKDKVNGESITCSSKAVTTKASAVIPILPIYASALYKVMLEKGLHETPIMHKYRFFKDMLYGDKREYDENGILRPDSWELRDDVQDETAKIMKAVNKDNFKALTAFDVFYQEFMILNGFGLEGIDYTKPVDLDVLNQLQP